MSFWPLSSLTLITAYSTDLERSQEGEEDVDEVDDEPAVPPSRPVTRANSLPATTIVLSGDQAVRQRDLFKDLGGGFETFEPGKAQGTGASPAFPK